MMFRIKRILFVLSFLAGAFSANAQVSGNFKVMGDNDKFYPVTFEDRGWNNNIVAELELGRSQLNLDVPGYGSLIAKFRYHVTAFGNGSDFIEADIRQQPGSYTTFVGGWKDVSTASASARIIIWLRGGGTTYNYTSRLAVNPLIYDGVSNPLPFVETGNNNQYNYKTTVDSFVNIQGKTYGSAYFSSIKRWTSNRWGQAIKLPRGEALEFDAGVTKFGMGATSDNFFYLFSTGVEDLSQPATYRMIMNNNGELGIGLVPVAGYKLLVDGTIGARRIKVTQGAWADFVFHEDYQLPSLQEVEKFIKINKHLPDIPSEKEVTENGIDVGEMNKKLLQKIEEMTLHMINMEKEIQVLKSQPEEMKLQLINMAKKIQELESNQQPKK